MLAIVPCNRVALQIASALAKARLMCASIECFVAMPSPEGVVAPGRKQAKLCLHRASHRTMAMMAITYICSNSRTRHRDQVARFCPREGSGPRRWYGPSRPHRMIRAETRHARMRLAIRQAVCRPELVYRCWTSGVSFESNALGLEAARLMSLPYPDDADQVRLTVSTSAACSSPSR